MLMQTNNAHSQQSSNSFSYPVIFKKGLNKEVVTRISHIKNEPEWMKTFRLEAFEIFLQLSTPEWGPDISEVKFNNISYYQDPTKEKAQKWEDVPKNIKEAYQELGIPQAEQKYLAGVSAQFESEVVYKNLKKKLDNKGVIFTDMDTALKRYPKLVKQYFAQLIPPNNNKFAALNSAVWSGGTFVYVPEGVQIDLPLHAFFLINQQDVGQFERTIIVADEGSFVHYIEGCSAPTYTTFSLHSGVVEVFVKKNAQVQYTTIQNWSQNVYNLSTKQAHISEAGAMQWIDANMGSRVTMKYPSCLLAGCEAKGEMLSVGYAGSGQHQDTGGKMIHMAPNTTSRIISKSVSKGGGRCSYRGKVFIDNHARNSSTFVTCDGLLLDNDSQVDTYPLMNINTKNTRVQHEATVHQLDDEKMYYLNSRGINKTEAESMLVNGFLEPVIRKIPLEYAVEMNRLIELEMEKSVG